MAEAVGPGGPRPVHFLASVGRAYLWPAHFWSPFWTLHITLVQFDITIAHYNVITSTGIENGTARQHGVQNCFDSFSLYPQNPGWP